MLRSQPVASLAAVVRCTVAWAVVAAAVADEPFRGELDLAGGRSLPGRLVPMAGGAEPRRTLAWESPLFGRPLEFHLDEIVGLRFPRPPADSPRADIRVHLRDGDVLEGDLESIDDAAVVIRPPAGWSPDAIRIQRDHVEGLSRAGGDAPGAFVGTAGLDGWDTTPPGSWRADRGCLRSSRPSTASRTVATAARAWYEFNLSWRSRPELRISVAAAADPAADAYQVELLTLADGTPDAAVVRREADRAALEPLACPPRAARSLRVVVFVDQEAGRLAAYTESDGVAGPVADVSLPAADRNASGRVRLALGAGDVCLERLRAGKWTAAEPVIDDRTASRITTRSGGTVEARLMSFEKEAGVVIVGGTGGTRRIPLDEFVAATLPTAADEAPPAATIRATLTSGLTLAGDPVVVDDNAIALRVAGVEDSVRIPAGEIAALTANATRSEPRSLPGRVGTLTTGSASLVGCVVDGGEWSTGIAFHPLGAVAAAPLAAGADIDAVVEYVARPARNADSVEVGGIGGMVSQNGEGAYVVTMLSEDGAAAVDGRLQPGDRLVAIKPRPEGGFVATKGLEVTTVMNLLRGRVGTPVVLRVASEGDAPRDIDLLRGPIHVAGHEILQQALDTHVRLAAAPADGSPPTPPARAVLVTGDVVPCEIVAIGKEGVRLRTPVADGGPDTITVAGELLQAVELDPAAAPRDLPRSLVDRLLTLPRSQRVAPPTHLVRLRDGDYLRGRLESLDAESVVIDVRGEVKKLPRRTVARIIWLHPAADPEGPEAGAADELPADLPPGLLVQGVAAGGRVTLVAEAVVDGVIRGTNPALGPGRIATADIDRLLLGRGITRESADLPFGRWRLKPAAEPRALREAGDPPETDR